MNFPNEPISRIEARAWTAYQRNPWSIAVRYKTDRTHTKAELMKWRSYLVRELGLTHV